MLARKALAGTAGAPKEYVEDVFQTWFYAGNDSTNTITNGVDLSGKGGLVWIKSRTYSSTNHILFDTERGATKRIFTNLTDAQDTTSTSLTSFNSNGFTLGSNASENNAVETKYVSWTFRKAKKFFDVVTYTGNGTAGRTISHNLGSTPGCIIVKNLTNSRNWNIYHRSAAKSGYTPEQSVTYFTTSATTNDSAAWNDTAPTSTVFTVGADLGVNASGSNYVAYLFAHDAGGFGDAGSDSIIKCGSSTGGGSAGDVTVNLGWEPQFVILKRTDSSSSGDWEIIDNMRGYPASSAGENYLLANSSAAEGTGGYWTGSPNATGFTHYAFAGATYIYIAIRRGPMKTPETGTSVFTPTAFSGNDTSGTRSAGLNAFDLLLTKRRDGAADFVWLDKLRGLAGNRWLSSASTSAEVVSGGTLDTINTINGQYTQDGINITKTSNYSYIDSGGYNFVWYALKRAPKFFDVVCYTGTGSTGLSVSHNLGVMPELIIIKRRDASVNWAVGTQFASSNFTFAFLNTTGAGYVNQSYNTSYGFYAQPTSTAFTLDTASSVNSSAGTYVAYLFASLPGVSKVGSYTGDGGSQDINCGFTNGARFIIIRNVTDADNWRVYDTARGIVSGNDPYLKLESTAVEVTTTDNVDPYSAGFNVSGGTNTNGKTFIYLAIA